MYITLEYNGKFHKGREIGLNCKSKPEISHKYRGV